MIESEMNGDGAADTDIFEYWEEPADDGGYEYSLCIRPADNENSPVIARGFVVISNGDDRTVEEIHQERYDLIWQGLDDWDYFLSKGGNQIEEKRRYHIRLKTVSSDEL